MKPVLNVTESKEATVPPERSHSFLNWANFFVGFALPAAVIIFTIIQSRNDTRIAQEHRQQDADLANRTRQLDLFLADDQNKENILNNYIQFLNKLLETHGRRLDRTDRSTAKIIARMNTLMVLEQLDPHRKSVLVRALYGGGLLDEFPSNKTPRIRSSIIPIDGASLSHIDLSVVGDDVHQRGNFYNAHLANIWLSKAIFQGLVMQGCTFYESDLSGADFGDTKTLEGLGMVNSVVLFSRAFLTHARFTGADYTAPRVSFSAAHMDDVDLQHFRCRRCLFYDAMMIRANLNYATIGRLNDSLPGQDPSAFRKTNLTLSTMYSTTFNNQSFVRTILNRSNMTRANLKVCKFANVAAADVSLEESQIENSSFCCSTFANVSFRDAKLYDVTFNSTDLTNTRFTHADLRQCQFSATTDLSDSDFTGASLVDVTFGGYSISFEQLSRARLLRNVVLSNRTLNLNNDQTLLSRSKTPS